MREPIQLPVLSDTMETGRLIQWLKQTGDTVKKGETLAELESDKAVMDVEAFCDGYLAGPLAETNVDIPVGQVIGYLVDSPEQSLSADAQAQKANLTEPEAPAQPGQSTAGQTITPVSEIGETALSPPETVTEGIKASPYARGLAVELGIDLRQAHAAPDGVIHAPQVLAMALTGSTPDLDAGPAYRYKLFTSMHRAVADNMIATLKTPTFHVSAHLSLLPLKDLAHEKHYSLTLLLARACALSVKAHIPFNAVYTARALAVRDQVDVGIAVNVPGGLVTPVLRDAAQRSFDELAADWRSLRDKIKRNRLSPGDYQGATFYLSNLGVFESVTRFQAIVPPGAAAILSLGAQQQDGKAEFSLSCDHRVVYGADAARFMETLSHLLADPQGILR